VCRASIQMQLLKRVGHFQNGSGQGLDKEPEDLRTVECKHRDEQEPRYCGWG
jgi:hypothetical protein